MLKVLKWVGIVLGGLIGLIVLAALVLYLIGSSRFNATSDVALEEFSAESGDVMHGRILAQTHGCAECHGADMGGTEFFNGVPFGYLPAPNLTSGEGGVGATFSDADFERAIRHGVGGDGRELIIMPSGTFHELADPDVADIVAYIRSVDAVDQDFGERRLHPLALILGGAGILPLDQLVPATAIDHSASHLAEVPTEEMALGEYRSAVCRDCHGANLNGGPHPFEEGVFVPNLTPAGDPGDWTEEDFIRAIREGTTPEGDTLDPDLMPWAAYSQYTDAELHALWVYLSSLEPIPTGGTEPQ